MPPPCMGEEDKDGDLNGDTLAAEDVLRPMLAVDTSTPLVRVNESRSRLTGETEDMEVILASLCRC